MGGPGLPETRSVWLTSALNLSACRPIDPQLLGGQRSRSVRSSTVHPLVQETAFVRTLDKKKKKKISVRVCVRARQITEGSLQGLQGRALCLFCVFVSR